MNLKMIMISIIAILIVIGLWIWFGKVEITENLRVRTFYPKLFDPHPYQGFRRTHEYPYYG